MRDPRMCTWPRKKCTQTIKAKPKSFARIEKMVLDQMISPLAPIGAALVSIACQQKMVQSTESNTVLDLASV